MHLNVSSKPLVILPSPVSSGVFRRVPHANGYQDSVKFGDHKIAPKTTSPQKTRLQNGWNHVKRNWMLILLTTIFPCFLTVLNPAVFFLIPGCALAAASVHFVAGIIKGEPRFKY